MEVDQIALLYIPLMLLVHNPPRLIIVLDGKVAAVGSLGSRVVELWRCKYPMDSTIRV